MSKPPKPPRCRVCHNRIEDPEDHEECLTRGSPNTGRLYVDTPPEPPEPRS